MDKWILFLRGYSSQCYPPNQVWLYTPVQKWQQFIAHANLIQPVQTHQQNNGSD